MQAQTVNRVGDGGMNAVVRTPLALKVGGLVVAVSCAAAAPAALAGGAPAARPALSTGTDYASSTIPAGTTLSGVVETTSAGGVTQGVTDFSDWRSKAVQSVTAYIGASTWASMTGITAQGQTNYFAGDGAHVSWSIPLIPANGSDTLENAATGADDAKYRSIAQQLVNGGDGNATLRLGWETGGDWFAWSGYKDPAAYVAAFRQAVTSMRAVPGAHFTFDWNYALGTTDPNALYPGDAYVDYVGADVYDQSYATSYPASDHAAVWNALVNGQWGLSWLADFASSHGKRLSIPEWGEAYKCDGHGGGDDPAFVQNMSQWIAQHDVAYEDYFNGDNSSCERYALETDSDTTSTFPNASAAYQALFGPLAVTPPAGAPSITVPSLPAVPTTVPSIKVPSIKVPSGAIPSVKVPTALPSLKLPTAVPSVTVPSLSIPSLGVPSLAVPTLPAATIDPALPSTPVSGAPVLMISERPDRGSALPLTSVVANGPSYVYLSDPGALSVLFTLDGTPLQLETTAPFDLAGNPDGSAAPVTFSPGAHRLTVTVTMPDGTQKSFTDDFSAN